MTQSAAEPTDPPDTGITIEEDFNETAVEFKSTNRPTKSGKAAKQQKVRDAESELLEKAIKSLGHATATATTTKSIDSLDCFGQYIASELRALDLCMQGKLSNSKHSTQCVFSVGQQYFSQWSHYKPLLLSL